MKVESIAEYSLGAFCNTVDLYLAIIGYENQFGLLFEWSLKTGFIVACLPTPFASKSMQFPTMWYVRPAPAHTRRLIRAFASCLSIL